jgi:hypothetical protein
MNGNEEVESFYRKLGYEPEPRISMGKKIPENIASAELAAAPKEKTGKSQKNMG